ncbi:alpha/beta hydrolase [Labrenzia sp. PHM005]|uniref:RBBP9/YdeN family alpha/beta hydrolase n=1 Tax=Labrenzia sp. PHM005 TaxID=2590016 RepID=UPI00113FD6A2|nr:alpha/beta hydrolase [Labrenzia sp. PHM005]QDG76940.1 serine hydrolase family protein [Labrenzia sp. PHM005]
MKISETDILLIPGYGKTLPGHWLLRWQDKMATARVVKQNELHQPTKKAWLETLVKDVEACKRPVVLVAHSLGCILVAHAAHALKGKIQGAYLVAPSDWDREGLVKEFDGGDFKPIPAHPLPFPAHVVASRNDPYCDYERAQGFAKTWGTTFQDAGEAGHINLESGHGPWPEGLMSFAHFMKKLG